MKQLLSTSVVVAFFAILNSACGSSASTSSAKSEEDAAQVEQNIIQAITPSIGAVSFGLAEAPAAGIWTEINVDFMIPCTMTGSFDAALNYTLDGENLKVVVAAYNIGKMAPVSEVTCQSFKTETKTISVPGVLDRENIILVNLAKNNTLVSNEFIGLNTLSDIKVVNAYPICGRGDSEMTCMAIGSYGAKSDVSTTDVAGARSPETIQRTTLSFSSLNNSQSAPNKNTRGQKAKGVF